MNSQLFTRIISLFLIAICSSLICFLVIKPHHEEKLHWRLTWQDEFQGDVIDPLKWEYQIGNGYVTSWGEYIHGWGNNELEYYTNSSENSYIKDGFLHIRAKKENKSEFSYTSARLRTKGLFSQKFGRFEVRAKLPLGPGLWSAVWLLPESEEYGRWAASGEIDILEAKGQNPNVVFGTLHFGGAWPNNRYTSKEFFFQKMRPSMIFTSMQLSGMKIRSNGLSMIITI